MIRRILNENFINSNNASPSIPSVKLNEFTTVTINNIVKGEPAYMEFQKFQKFRLNHLLIYLDQQLFLQQLFEIKILI